MPKKSTLLTPEVVREHLIKAGVKNLKEFGYPSVDKENILTDMVYKEFFSRMLEENLGTDSTDLGKTINTEIKKLQKEIK